MIRLLEHMVQFESHRIEFIPKLALSSAGEESRANGEQYLTSHRRLWQGFQREISCVAAHSGIPRAQAAQI